MPVVCTCLPKNSVSPTVLPVLHYASGWYLHTKKRCFTNKIIRKTIMLCVSMLCVLKFQWVVWSYSISITTLNTTEFLQIWENSPPKEETFAHACDINVLDRRRMQRKTTFPVITSWMLHHAEFEIFEIGNSSNNAFKTGHS